MTAHVDDRKLARRMLKGDKRAFDDFFREYFGRLYRFALQRMDGDEQAAAEVVLASLNKALTKLDGYRGEAALFTWLCTIVRNGVIDHRRATARWKDNVVLVEDWAEIEAVVDAVHRDAGRTPDGCAEQVEARRLIQVALDRLPARYGDALEWKYVHGLSVREIAGRLDVGEEAAASLLARAKRAFREVYTAMTRAAEVTPISAGNRTT